jgi:probable rRNA maturation factor
LVIAVLNAARVAGAPAEIRSAIEAAASLPEVAARLPTAGWDVAVRISGDQELRRLNRRFLGDDHPTDVLSFPTEERGPSAHLGDIVVSWAAVRRQAADYGHGDRVELALLAVHGFLHLLGWDHATVTEDAEMARLTLAALRRGGTQIAGGRLVSHPSPG